MQDDESRLRSSSRLKTSIRKYGRRNLYIARSDLDVWIRAELFAKEHDVSISSLVVQALSSYLDATAS